MDISAINSAVGSSNDGQGFSEINSETFMKLLITELQNQDPLSPMENEQLLNQISMMRNLSSNIELGETMQKIGDAVSAVTVNQQLSSAAVFIGKHVSGTTADEVKVEGQVDRAFLRDGTTFLGIGDQELRLDQVSTVNSE